MKCTGVVISTAGCWLSAFFATLLVCLIFLYTNHRETCQRLHLPKKPIQTCFGVAIIAHKQCNLASTSCQVISRLVNNLVIERFERMIIIPTDHCPINPIIFPTKSYRKYCSNNAAISVGLNSPSPNYCSSKCLPATSCVTDDSFLYNID